MNITAATNWDDELIRSIAGINKSAKNRVVEVFGSTRNDFLGSSRPSSVLPKVSLRRMKEHIKLCHEKGLKFNYVINAISYNNKEFSPKFRDRLLRHVKMLISIEVDSLTLTNPLFIETIRANFPKLYICASTVCKIDTLQRIRWYENLGVNRIVLETDINRNFHLLRRIRESTKAEIEVLANLQCILLCPNNTYDYICDGFRSQARKDSLMYYYPKIKCTEVKLKNPVELIKSPWVRPEDIETYRQEGIDYIKVAGREAPTNWLKNAIEAYSRGRYEGNIFDLIGSGVISSVGATPCTGLSRLPPLMISLDNAKLKGFIRFFAEEKCDFDCDRCDFCGRWLKHLRIDENAKKDYLKRAGLLLEGIRKNKI